MPDAVRKTVDGREGAPRDGLPDISRRRAGQGGLRGADVGYSGGWGAAAGVRGRTSGAGESGGAVGGEDSASSVAARQARGQGGLDGVAGGRFDADFVKELRGGGAVVTAAQVDLL